MGRAQGEAELRDLHPQPNKKTAPGKTSGELEDPDQGRCTQNEAVSFCNLTCGLLLLLHSPGNMGSSGRHLVSEPASLRVAPLSQLEILYAASRHPVLPPGTALTSNVHLVASVTHGNILAIPVPLHLDCISQTASYKQKCLRNPFSI